MYPPTIRNAAKRRPRRSTGKRIREAGFYVQTGENAADVYNQKLREGQDIAEAVLDAEMRLGELRREVPRNFNRGNQYTEAKAERTAIAETQLQRFDNAAQLERHAAQAVEALAAHPEIVETTRRFRKN